MFISRDSGALCVGAEEVARASARPSRSAGSMSRSCAPARAACTGSSRLVEVARPEGRIGYGPVKPSDIDSLLDAGMLDGGKHPLSASASSRTSRSSRSQTRLTFAACGIIDPRSLEDYKAHGGYKGLAKAHRRRARGDRRGGGQFRLARPRRRRLPHRHQMAHRRPTPGPSRNTSSATPTKAIPAPSPTA